MPRYRVEEKKPRAERISVFSLLFPLLSVLYAEGMAAYFSGYSMDVYKVLFALAAGAFSVALSRLTPWRAVNFVLQTLWQLFCFGWITVQFLCFAAGGAYLSLFVPGENLPPVSAVLGIAASNLPFLICMLVPAVLQFTLQAMSLLRRRSLLGKLLGGDWMELLGMLLLALILSFTSVTLAMRDDAGTPSPRYLVETAYDPVLSAEIFGILPQTALDLKFNVLHIAEEEVVKHYIVTGDGTQVEVTEREAASWLQEG